MSRLLASNATRRTFLAASACTAVGATVLGRANPLGAAGAMTTASAATRVVWRLNPDWGYPLGPKGRTKVSSNASRLHAQNKIFVSEAAARAGRLSLCSLAQPYSVEMCEADYNSLWTHSMDGGISTDMRCPGVPEIMARAGSVCTVPVPPPVPPTPPVPLTPPFPTTPPTANPVGVPATYSPLPTTPKDTDSSEALLKAVKNAEALRAVEAARAAASKAPSGSLPLTGGSTSNLAAIGLGLLAVGAAATAAGHASGNIDSSLQFEGATVDTE